MDDDDANEMLREALGTVNGLRVRVEELEAELGRERRERNAAERERENALFELQAMRKRMAEIRDEFSAEEATNRSLQIRLDRLEVDAQGHAAEAKELTSKLASAQANASKKEEMHGKLNALLEQQARDGDELARELRKQVGESNAQIHVLRRALLRAGEVNSKLESSKLELSKSLGEAQDLVRGTRRLKEEGPVRMREYVKNVIEGLFQDVLAAGGPLNHDHWSYGGGGDGLPQQSYEQLKRENAELSKRMRNVDRVFSDMADENARLAVQLDRCVSMVEAAQARGKQQISEVTKALEEKTLYAMELERRLVDCEVEASVDKERGRAKADENHALMQGMSQLHAQVTASKQALLAEERELDSMMARLRGEEHSFQRMIEGAEAGFRAMLEEAQRQRSNLEGLRGHTHQGVERGGTLFGRAVQQLEGYLQEFEAGMRSRAEEGARRGPSRLQGMGADDSKASHLLGGSDSKRINDFISKLGVEGGGGKKTRQRQGPAASASSTRAAASASGTTARRPSSAPALKQPPWRGPSLGSSSSSSPPATRDPVRVSQHMAPTSAGYSRVKGESRGEAARVLKSAQSLLDKTYNRSASALSHSQL